MVGSITQNEVLEFLLENPLRHAEEPVQRIMSPPFPLVAEDLAFRQLGKYLNKEVQAVVARDKAGNYHILTQYDIIRAV
jgi:cystathionine beta-synthase